MRSSDKPQNPLLKNGLWFIVSMALAFFVWVVATLESDPIETREFENIEIQVDYDEGLVITSQSAESVTVNVRAPGSILEDLRDDDIQVVAKVPEARPGEYRITLEASVSRRAVPDPVPRLVTVTVEEELDKLVPVTWVISEQPPPGFELTDNKPTLATNQVLVSGPASLVQQVINANVILNLSQRRNPFTNDLRLLAIDVDGNVVEGVTIEPQTIQVEVNIQTRSDIRQVSVTPNVLAETLPTGYTLNSIEYDPRILLITGSQSALADAPGSLLTTPIDLTDRTTSFTDTVTVQVPNDDLFIFGRQTIQVTVNIEPLLSTRQIEGIPIEIIGLREADSTEILPAEVSVLITGPQGLLETLQSEDMRVVVDLNGLGDGNHQIAPVISLSIDESLFTNITVLPAVIDVTIHSAIGENAQG